MQREFTRELADLYVVQNIGLSESLRIMKHKGLKKSCKISKTADYLLNCLENGNLFSNGLKTCPFINFDDSYVMFVGMSEKTGELRETVKFLAKKYQRKFENRAKLLEVSIYPLFVIITAVAAFCLLFKLEGAWSGEEGVAADFLEMLFVLGGICCAVFFAIWKLISEDKLYEAFLEIDFMIRGGVNLSSAIKAVVEVFGQDSRLGKVFSAAGEKLEFGMNLESSFNLGERFEEAFYYADAAGNKSDVFHKLAEWINEKSEKRRKICLNMVEPVFISITGVFLLLLVMKYYLPYMNGLSIL